MRKLSLIAAVFISLLACKKKEDNNNANTTVPPPVSTPLAPVFFINIPSDAHGVLMASQTEHEFTNNYITQLGKASAFFYSAPGNYSYVDAGVVKCNDSVLVKQSSGSYLFNGKPINGQPLSGINYGSGSVWTISGTASVPAFTFTTVAFPTMAALTSGTLISKTSSYNVTFGGAANSDSVVVMITGDSTNMQKKIVSAGSGICNFTAAEIGAVKKAGSTAFPYINLVSYRIQANTVSTKKYYLVNTISSSYRVNIQ